MNAGKGNIHERSAGAVVFHRSPTGREYLLLRYGAGHWGFPKGHVEAGETDWQAATREVTEETSIAATDQVIVPGFEQDTDYMFRRGRAVVDKKVRFYLVESRTRTVHISSEHTDHVWLPYERAIHQLSFDGPRRVLQLAEQHLAKPNGTSAPAPERP